MPPRRSRPEWQSDFSWMASLDSLFGLLKAFDRFFAERAPDLRDEPAESVGDDDRRVARMRQVDGDDGFHLPGPRGQDHHAVGKLHRLVDVVGDQNDRLFELVADAQQFLAENDPGLLGEDNSLFLWDGISLISVTIGLFAIPEIIELAVQGS